MAISINPDAAGRSRRIPDTSAERVFFLVLANFSFYVPHTDDDDVTAQRDNSCPYIRVTVEERPTTVGS